MDNRPIGVFDSGIGGLTVLREIAKFLPYEKIIYLGDTARVPWGTRGKEIIIKFSLQLANFLAEKKVKFIVVACHTASSVALPVLKRKIKIPILDVIRSTVDETLLKTKNLQIGIIGTPATIKSGTWARKLKEKEPEVSVFSASCPLFVPLAEEGLFNHKVTEIIAREYLKPLVKKKIDTLILACTHYPLLSGTIKKIVGQKVKLVNPGVATAKSLVGELGKRNLFSKDKQKGGIEIFLTDTEYKAIEVFNKLFDHKFKGKIIKADLGKYD
ncbi:MAG: glutamate racemase [Microgenomates group bacterium]